MSNDFIKIRVVGPGFGESILINICDEYRIVIDSNNSLALYNGDKNIIEDFFGTLSDPIDFWMISHFHFDHFQNFTNFNNKYKIKKVYLPDFDTISDLENLIYSDTFYSKNDKLHSVDSRSQYTNIKKNAGKDYDKYTGKSFGCDNIADKRINNKNLIIKYYAMSHKDMMHSKANSIKGIGLKKTSGRVINKSSYIVELNFGEFNALFLSDAPNYRIRSVLSNIRKVDFVKLSHHGSLKSNTIHLLNLFKRKGTKDFVITPFDSKNLPNKTVLNWFYDNNRNCFVTKKNNRRKDELINFHLGQVFEVISNISYYEIYRDFYYNEI